RPCWSTPPSSGWSWCRRPWSCSATATGGCPGAPTRAGSPAGVVVRRFLGDVDVVGVRLAQPCRRDAHEPAVAVHLVDGRGAAVAHGRSQAADELVDDVGERALVDDPALDALGDQLVLGGDVAL